MAEVPANADLLKGLTNKSASASDASTTHKGGSVNDEPTRSSVGKASKTLGPRTA